MDREQLGRLVRATFAKWAEGRPDAKPSWTVPWDRMPEAEREVDRLIGEAVAGAVLRPVCQECGKPIASPNEASEEVGKYQYGAHAPSCWRASRGSCSTPEHLRRPPGGRMGWLIKSLMAARTALKLNPDSKSAEAGVRKYAEQIADEACKDPTALENVAGIDRVTATMNAAQAALVDAQAAIRRFSESVSDAAFMDVRASARKDALLEASRLCVEAGRQDTRAGFKGGPALAGMAVALERLAAGGPSKPQCYCGAPSCDICHP